LAIKDLKQTWRQQMGQIFHGIQLFFILITWIFINFYMYTRPYRRSAIFGNCRIPCLHIRITVSVLRSFSRSWPFHIFHVLFCFMNAKNVGIVKYVLPLGAPLDANGQWREGQIYVRGCVVPLNMP
jgi:hypothetical protein